MPTALQIKLIHVAAKQASLNDAQYRTLLRNVGDVESSRYLTQSAFEDVMAVIEDSGFRERDKPGDYWRAKVRMRGQIANPRMTAKIHALAADSRYTLGALCGRFSEGRAAFPEQLTPREAWLLIEMLKASNAREAKPRKAAVAEPGLFPQMPARAPSLSVSVPGDRPICSEPFDEDVPF